MPNVTYIPLVTYLVKSFLAGGLQGDLTLAWHAFDLGTVSCGEGVVPTRSIDACHPVDKEESTSTFQLEKSFSLS